MFSKPGLSERRLPIDEIVVTRKAKPEWWDDLSKWKDKKKNQYSRQKIVANKVSNAEAAAAKDLAGGASTASAFPIKTALEIVLEYIEANMIGVPFTLEFISAKIALKRKTVSFALTTLARSNKISRRRIDRRAYEYLFTSRKRRK